MNNLETIAVQILSTVIILGYLRFMLTKLTYHINNKSDEAIDKILNNKIKGSDIGKTIMDSSHKGNAGRRF